MMQSVSRYASDSDRRKQEEEIHTDLATLLWLAENCPHEAAVRAGRVCPHCGEALAPKIVDAPLPWDKAHRRVQWPDRCGCPGEAQAAAAGDGVATGDAGAWKPCDSDEACIVCDSIDDLDELKRFWEMEDEMPEVPESWVAEAMRETDERVLDCRVCQAAKATGDDELCDGCRTTTVASRIHYVPLPAGDLKK